MTFKQGKLPFPAPPPGKAGWPWDVVTSQPLPASMPDGRPWPRISIVTPSINQGQFIEETVRSVLLQGYPNLEYIIIDGGSTDGTVEIIRKYEPWLTYWVSEADNGQSHAINKGFARSSGEILCWLNSDDFFAPDSLRGAAEALHAGDTCHVVYGDCIKIVMDSGKRQLVRGRFPGQVRMLVDDDYALHQPSVFWRREVYEAIGGLDESLHLIMDFDYWFRAAGKHQFKYINRVLSYSHLHAAAKTGDNFVRYTVERRSYSKYLAKGLCWRKRLQYEIWQLLKGARRLLRIAR